MILKQGGPQHKMLLSILGRLGFLFYWIFDNIAILSKVKYLQGVDTSLAAKRAATFWLIGLVFSIALTLVQMYDTAQEEAFYKGRKKQFAGDEKKLQETTEKLHQLNKKKVENVLNLLKNLGDTVTASQAIGLPRKLVGIDFNDGQVGIGGLTSALITCY